MPKTSCLLLFSIGVLLAADGVADDKDATDSDDEQARLETRTATAPNSEWPFSYLWRSRYPLEATPYTEILQGPIAGIDFQDSSVYGRVSKLRNLSFLTLAEIGNERLFVGVNEDGLVGIHFNAFSNKNDQDYLEVVRLPYLNKPDSDNDADQLNEKSGNPPPQQMTDSW